MFQTCIIPPLTHTRRQILVCWADGSHAHTCTYMHTPRDHAKQSQITHLRLQNSGRTVRMLTKGRGNRKRKFTFSPRCDKWLKTDVGLWRNEAVVSLWWMSSFILFFFLFPSAMGVIMCLSSIWRCISEASLIVRWACSLQHIAKMVLDSAGRSRGGMWMLLLSEYCFASKK